MTKKYIEKKTNNIWGKGGAIISCFLVFCLVFQPLAFAGRSSAGGGKLSEPDWDKVATNLAITVGTMAIGSSINSGLNAAKPISTLPESASMIDKFGSGIKSTFSTLGNFVTNTGTGNAGLDTAGNAIKPLAAMGDGLLKTASMGNIASGFGTFVAASQVNRAVGMAGSYYGWKPSTTFIVSSVATGSTVGLLNPSIALGDALPEVTLANAANQAALEYTMPTMMQGAFVGGMGGLASSGAIVAIDGSKINKGKSPGTVAQIAGVVAGDFGAQFGREVFNPETWHPVTGIYKQENIQAAAASRNIQYPGEKNAYLPITDVNNKTGQPVYGTAIPDSKFESDYLADNFKYKQVVPGVFKLVDTSKTVGLGTGLGNSVKGAFYNTFSAQHTPLLASRALSIALTNQLSEDKQYLSPLVSSLTQSISHPVFSSLTNTYGIDAARYFASGNDKIEANLRYDYGVRAMARDNELSVSNAAKDQARITFESNPAVQKFDALVRQSNGNTQDLYAAVQSAEIDGKPLIEVYDAAFDQYELALARTSRQIDGETDQPKAYNLINPIEELKSGSYGSLDTKLRQTVYTSSDRQVTIPSEQRQLDVQAQALAGSLRNNEITWGARNRNLAITQEGMRLTNMMNTDENTRSQALAKVDVNKWDLFSGQALSGVRSGIFEGLVSGGIESGFDKFAQNKGETQKMLLSGVANFSTAAVRGVAWNLGWDRTTKDWQWYDKWDFVMPEQYGVEPGKDNFDFLQYKVSKANYDEEMLKFNRFMAVTGVTQDNGLILHRERQKWDFAANNGQGGWVNDPRWVVSVISDNEKPSLSYATEASLKQAQVEVANDVLSFGRPFIAYKGEAGFGIEPQKISALTFMDYVSSVRNLSYIKSQGGLGSVIAYSYTQANKDALANNIGGTLLQIPGVAKTFSMQPQRLTKLYTQQDKGYEATRTTDKIDLTFTKNSLDKNTATKLTYNLKNQATFETKLPQIPGAETGGFEPLSRTVTNQNIVFTSNDLAQLGIDRTIVSETGIQHQYVLSGIPNLPYTVQSLRFNSGQGSMETSFWAPFPNPLFGVRPQTGEGDYLRRKGQSN